MAKKDRDRLIRTFQKRTGTSKTDIMRDARLAAIADTKRTGRVNTLFPRSAMFTPPNAAKTPRGDKATLTRSNSGEPPSSYYREDDPRWVSPRTVPGYGQVRNKQKPPPRLRYGNPNIVPGYGQSARKRHAAKRRARKQPYQSPSAYGRGGPQWN